MSNPALSNILDDLLEKEYHALLSGKIDDIEALFRQVCGPMGRMGKNSALRQKHRRFCRSEVKIKHKSQ